MAATNLIEEALQSENLESLHYFEKDQHAREASENACANGPEKIDLAY